MINQEQIYSISKQPSNLSVVIRCGRDRDGLQKCLDSIDESVEVVVGASEDATFVSEILDHGYIVAPHKYGNWSVAAENGLKASNYNDIIIMDADSVFASGAIHCINSALKAGHLLVQPHVEFKTNNSFGSKVVSKARSHENRYTAKAFSPGLGLKRQELLQLIGVDGNIYHPKVMFGDDGYIDQKAQEANIRVFVAKDAIIYHSPINLSHELKNAFQFGRSEAQIEKVRNNNSGIWHQLVLSYFTRGAVEYYQQAWNNYGLDTAMFATFWRMLYLAGYESENYRHVK